MTDFGLHFLPARILKILLVHSICTAKHKIASTQDLQKAIAPKHIIFL